MFVFPRQDLRVSRRGDERGKGSGLLAFRALRKTQERKMNRAAFPGSVSIVEGSLAGVNYSELS